VRAPTDCRIQAAPIREDPRFQSLMEDLRPLWESIVAWEKGQESRIHPRRGRHVLQQRFQV